MLELWIIRPTIEITSMNLIWSVIEYTNMFVIPATHSIIFIPIPSAIIAKRKVPTNSADIVIGLKPQLNQTKTFGLLGKINFRICCSIVNARLVLMCKMVHGLMAINIQPSNGHQYWPLYNNRLKHSLP